MSEPIPHAAFVAPDPAELAPLFPGYDIVGLIATGGMGAVYQAVQRSLDRNVAIKILPQEFSKDKAFCAIFEAEAKAMAKLNHPNLIGVYDFGEVAGMLYIIMEYVPGQSVFHSANGVAIDQSEVVRIVTGICHGLAHAHGHGVIHRDIKPSNILLDLEARPKIGDFGLARNTGHVAEEGEEIFGTPHYTAPEVVNAPQSVDHRADIFSLGVLLHELLTGRLPADDPRPPSVISRCSPRFDAIVRRATDEIPTRRYNSALEIAKDLQAIITTSGPKAVPRSAGPPKIVQTGQRIKKTTPAPKESSSAAAVIFLIIVVLSGFLAFRHYRNAKTIETNKLIEEHMKQANDKDSPQSIPHEDPELEENPITLPPDKKHPIAINPPDPAPDPDTDPDPDSGPDPDPQPNPEIKPKFDVDDFLDNRARKIMRERSAPLIAARSAEFARNLAACERELSSEARKESRTILRDEYASSIKDYVKECQESGNALTEDLPDSLDRLAGAERIHDDFLRKQQVIEQKLAREMASLADMYVMGIEKQIDRLRQAKDPAAVKLLEKEIDAVRENKKYFPRLILDN